MRVVVDRFEGSLAVVEAPDGRMRQMDRELLPGANEGDLVVIEVDHDATSELRRESQELFDLLKRKNGNCL